MELARALVNLKHLFGFYPMGQGAYRRYCGQRDTQNRLILGVLAVVLAVYAGLSLALVLVKDPAVRFQGTSLLYFVGFSLLLGEAFMAILVMRLKLLSGNFWLLAFLLTVVLTALYLNWVDLHTNIDFSGFLIALLGIGLLFSGPPMLYVVVFPSCFLILSLAAEFTLPRPLPLQNMVDLGLYTLMGLSVCLLQEGRRRRTEIMSMSLEDLNSQLKETSLRDPLTGLYNRRFLREFLEKQISMGKRADTALSVIMIDLDHFKKVNDTFGHPVGDTVLKELAELLILGTREADLVARYGGEEFLLVLPRTPIVEAMVVAHRIHGSIRSNRFSKVPWTITASMGVCEAGPDDSLDSLVSRVDLLLYEAKKSRDTVVRD